MRAKGSVRSVGQTMLPQARVCWDASRGSEVVLQGRRSDNWRPPRGIGEAAAPKPAEGKGAAEERKRTGVAGSITWRSMGSGEVWCRHRRSRDRHMRLRRDGASVGGASRRFTGACWGARGYAPIQMIWRPVAAFPHPLLVLPGAAVLGTCVPCVGRARERVSPKRL
jgi:hypothetical protein